MGVITGTEVRKQLKADLIGKDSYRGVTLTYTWLANQFGHISLGFLPSFILFLVFSKYHKTSNPSLYAAIIISGTWLLFETYNFLGPLLLQKHSSSKVLFVPGSTYNFQPAWKNIAFDTITDLCFFWFGAFSASLLCEFSVLKLIILLVLVVVLIYPSCYWYPTKMYLQAAQYPYQLRLAQWDLNISAEDKSIVQRFLDADDRFHLFVFGEKDCGKTSLGVGIATEVSIKHRPVVYTTAMKLAPMLFETKETLLLESGALWTWRNCDILVIDDINPGDPVKKDLISPATFKDYVNTFSTNDVNRETLAKLKTIWVMGSDDPQNEIITEWTTMLQSIGVEPHNILSVNLLPKP